MKIAQVEARREKFAAIVAEHFLEAGKILSPLATDNRMILDTLTHEQLDALYIALAPDTPCKKSKNEAFARSQVKAFLTLSPEIIPLKITKEERAMKKKAKVAIKKAKVKAKESGKKAEVGELKAGVNAKGWVRYLFPDKKICLTLQQITNKSQCSESAVKTAISDLKNVKYASGDTLVIAKNTDGKFARV